MKKKPNQNNQFGRLMGEPLEHRLLLTNVAPFGSVDASTTFPGFPASFSIDGSRSTSWFSEGPGEEIDDHFQPTSIFTWTGNREYNINEIKILSNKEHSNPDFREGFGFGLVEVELLDSSNRVKESETRFLGGTPDPDVSILINHVDARVVRLTFWQHEAADCGGFSELEIHSDLEPPESIVSVQFDASTPHDGLLTSDSTPGLTWKAPSDKDGGRVAKYVYNWHRADTSPDPANALSTTATSTTLPELPDGDWQFSVFAVDDSNNIGPARGFRFTVETDDPPEADAGGPYFVDEGGAVNLDASRSSDPNGDFPERYEWDINNAGFLVSSSTSIVPVRWTDLVGSGVADDGDFPVQVRVTAGGLTDTSEPVMLSVRNVPPSLTRIDPIDTVLEGDTFVLSGLVFDPSPSDTFRIDANWKPGEQDVFEFSQDAFELPHAYSDNGSYRVSLSLQDDDGGSIPPVFVDVVVENAPPSVEISNASESISLGQTINLRGIVSDPGDDAFPSRVWDVTASNGESVPTTDGEQITFRPKGTGRYDIRHTVTDDDGGVGFAEISIFVHMDVAPLRLDGQFWLEQETGMRRADGEIFIGHIPQAGTTFAPVARLDGNASFDGSLIRGDGILSTLRGVPIPHVFDGTFDIHAGATEGTVLDRRSTIRERYQLAGAEMHFSRLDFASDRLAIQGIAQLPPSLGGISLLVNGPHWLVFEDRGIDITAEPIRATDLVAVIPGIADLHVSRVAATYDSTEDRLKLQGKVEIKDLMWSVDVTADFSGNNFLQLKDGNVDVKGRLEVGDLGLPRNWGLKEFFVDLDTTISPIRFGAGGELRLPHARASIEADFSFRGSQIDAISLDVDGLNISVGAGVFWQRIAGGITGLADGPIENFESPVGRTGAFGLSIGPALPVDLKLPTFLGGDFMQGDAIARLDVAGEFNTDRLKANGKFTVLKKLLEAEVDAELNWRSGFFQADGEVRVPGGLFVADGRVISDSSGNLTIEGTGTVQLPEPSLLPSFPLPRWILGASSLVASGTGYFQYRNNDILSDDYVMAFGDLTLTGFGSQIWNGTLGVKVDFTGDVDLLFSMAQIDRFISPDAALSETAAYQIPEDAGLSMFFAQWDKASSAVDFELTAPGGRVFTRDTLPENIGLIDELATDNSIAVGLAQPDDGQWGWKVSATDGSDLGQISLYAYKDSFAPEFEIASVRVDRNGTQGTLQYRAEWDESTVVNVDFYSGSNFGPGSEVIGSMLVNEETGTFQWTIEDPKDVPAYIYAVVDDGQHPPVTVSSKVGLGYIGGNAWQDLDQSGFRDLGEHGLVGYWDFNHSDERVAIDRSAFSNHGEFVADPRSVRSESLVDHAPYVAENTLQFDGDDAINVGATESLRMSSSFTLAAWVNPSGPGSSEAGGGVIATREGEYQLARFPDGSIRYAVATDPNGGWMPVDTGVYAPIDQWTHLALTFNGGRVSLYRNGVLAYEGVTANDTITDAHPNEHDFRIGGRQSEPQFFEGLIDNVEVWNVPRSQEQIVSTFRLGPSGAELGLSEVEVFLDTNRNGEPDDFEPTSITDAFGNYEFGGLVSGDYNVVQMPRDGWLHSYPIDSSHSVDIRTGYSVAFDGVDDYVQIGDVPELHTPASLTMEAWIYPTGIGSHAGDSGAIIINQEGEYEIARFEDGSVQWALCEVEECAFIDTGFHAPENEWTHVAVTFDGEVVRTYGNGRLVDTHPRTNPIGHFNRLVGMNDFRIGGRQALSQHFDGRIDEVRIWSHARSQADIESSLNKRLVGTEPGLLGYWAFDEGTGSIAFDASPNANAGEVVEGVYRVGVGRLVEADFGNAPKEDSSISGFVWRDDNGDGAHSVDERALPDVELYIDENANGIPEEHEVRTTTNAEGRYVFDVPPGKYAINIISDPENLPTFPASGYQFVSLGPGDTDDDRNFGIVPSYAVDGEFPINSTSEGVQRSPVVAIRADGGYVVVWDGKGNQDDNGIFGQLYDSNGREVGNEFSINSTTNDRQWAPSVAMDLDGDFVVTWNSQGQDGSSAGVFARRFDASGNPKGPEFQVNVFTGDDQGWSNVAMNDLGTFVVSWVSRGQDDDGWGVYARAFDEHGVPATTEIAVNQTTNGHQQEAKADVDRDGSFVLTWSSSGDGVPAEEAGTYARLFNPDGRPRGPEFPTFDIDSSNAREFRGDPDVAITASGIVIVYEKNGVHDGVGIYGRRFTSDGVALGPEFEVYDVTGGNRQRPVIAASPDGGFTVAWQSEHQDTSSWGVYFRRFDSDGVGQRRAFSGNTTVVDSQHFPALAFGENGTSIVVWQSDGQDGDGGSIYGRRYQDPIDAFPPHVSGVLIDGKQIHDMDVRVQPRNQITVAFSETVRGADDAANWTLSRDGVGIPNHIDNLVVDFNDDAKRFEASFDILDPVRIEDGIYTLALRDAVTDTSGNALDGDYDSIAGSNFAIQFRVETLIENTALKINEDLDGVQFAPHTAASTNGHVLAWSGGPNLTELDVFMRSFDENGGLLSDEVRVNSTVVGKQNGVKAAVGAGGDVVVVWNHEIVGGSDVEVRGQRFDQLGTKRGDEFPVSVSESGVNTNADVAIDASGRFWITWMGRGPDGIRRVLARRYDSDGQTFDEETPLQINQAQTPLDKNPRLAVDAHGNAVVVWESNGQDGSGWGIYRRFLPFHSPNAFSERRVNVTRSGDQLQSRVATSPSGESVVVWASTSDHGGFNLFGRRYDPNGQQIGGEFPISDIDDALRNVAAEVAMAPDGGFMVTWTAEDDPGVPLRLLGRLFGSDGTPLGPSFDIAEPKTGLFARLGSAVRISAVHSGGYVVAWGDDDGSGTEMDIFSRQYMIPSMVRGAVYADVNANGIRDTGEVGLANRGVYVDLNENGLFDDELDPHVRTGEDGEYRFGELPFGVYSVAQIAEDGDEQTEPRSFGSSFLVGPSTSETIQMGQAMTNDAGDIVIIWTEEDNVYGYKDTGLSSGGASGESFIVSEGGTAKRSLSAAALREDGAFIVLWKGATSADADSDIYARIYDSAGNAPEEFVLNTPSEKEQVEVAAAVDPSGNFVITWRENAKETNAENGILATVIDGSGSPVLPEFTVSAVARDDNPVVAVQRNGDFLVVWSREVPGGELFNVYGKLYDAGGRVIKNEFLIPQHSDGNQLNASVSADGQGGYVVLWDDFPATDMTGRRLSAQGNPMSNEILIDPPGGTQSAYTDSVAMDASGSFVAVWQSGTNGLPVTMRRFSRVGNDASEPIDIATGTMPSIDMDSQGNFVIAWVQPGVGVHTQRFTSSLNSDFQIVDAAIAEVVENIDFGLRAAQLDGDLDGDGTVDFNDLVRLAASFGKSGTSRFEGDLDGDGTTDFTDFLILAENFGRSLLDADA